MSQDYYDVVIPVYPFLTTDEESITEVRIPTITKKSAKNILRMIAADMHIERQEAAE